MNDGTWVAAEAGWYRITIGQPAQYIGPDQPDDEPEDGVYLVHLDEGDGMAFRPGPPGPPPGFESRPDGQWVDIDWDGE